MDPPNHGMERLVPDSLVEGDATGRATLELHEERYHFAAGHLPSGRVLDLACGVGYGARILAGRPGVSVLGLDVSSEAIDYARRRYGGAGLEFRVADGMRFEDPQGFDAIVSLETVEHVDEPDRFLARLTGLLRPDGILIASVPTTPSVDLNPHHRHDFSERSFRRSLLGLGFREIDCLRQVQRVPALAVLLRRESRMGDLRSGLLTYYALHPSALARRLASTLRYGLANRYLTLACRRRD